MRSFLLTACSIVCVAGFERPHGSDGRPHGGGASGGWAGRGEGSQGAQHRPRMPGCLALANQTACEGAPGCVWNATGVCHPNVMRAMNHTRVNCSGIADEMGCSAARGCVWNATRCFHMPRHHMGHTRPMHLRCHELNQTGCSMVSHCAWNTTCHPVHSRNATHGRRPSGRHTRMNCSGLASEMGCNAAKGCVWNATRCHHMPRHHMHHTRPMHLRCHELNQTGCSMVPHCAWNTTCHPVNATHGMGGRHQPEGHRGQHDRQGTSSPCLSLTAAACFMREGQCAWHRSLCLPVLPVDPQVGFGEGNGDDGEEGDDEEDDEEGDDEDDHTRNTRMQHMRINCTAVPRQLCRRAPGCDWEPASALCMSVEEYDDEYDDDEEEDDDKPPMWLLAAGAALLFVAGGAAVALCCYCRRQQPQAVNEPAVIAKDLPEMVNAAHGKEVYEGEDNL